MAASDPPPAPFYSFSYSSDVIVLRFTIRRGRHHPRGYILTVPQMTQCTSSDLDCLFHGFLYNNSDNHIQDYLSSMIGIQTYAWAGVNMAADHSVERLWWCHVLDTAFQWLLFSRCYLIDQAFIVKGWTLTWWRRERETQSELRWRWWKRVSHDFMDLSCSATYTPEHTTCLRASHIPQVKGQVQHSYNNSLIHLHTGVTWWQWWHKQKVKGHRACFLCSDVSLLWCFKPSPCLFLFQTWMETITAQPWGGNRSVFCGPRVWLVSLRMAFWHWLIPLPALCVILLASRACCSHTAEEWICPSVPLPVTAVIHPLTRPQIWGQRQELCYYSCK